MIPNIEPLENNEGKINIENCTSTNPAPIGTKVARTAAQTAMLMAILTLGSKLLGFVREMVMAACFGTSFVVDAYVMAIAIPSILLGGIFAAVDTAYMPLFSKITELESKEEGNKFTSEVVNLLFLVSVIACIIGFFSSNQLVKVLASGFTKETAELTSFFVKIAFAYLIFLSISGILEAMLRYRGVFLTPIVIGYLQNVAIILVIVLSAYYNYYFLAFGMLIGHALRFIIMWVIAKNKDFKYYFSLKFGSTSKKILALSLPVFIGSGINQINTFVDKTLASGLQEGSIAALNYGYLIISLIISLTVSIITTIIYPKMTQAQALNDQENFNRIVGSGFNIIIIIAVPSSMGAMVYNDQIVQIVYERGAFDLLATQLTGTALFYYAIGLIFFALNTLLVQTYYSMYDMKTPVIYGAVGVIINIVLNLILVRYLAHGGLALATSIAAICNSMLLYYGMKKTYPKVIIVKKVKDVIKVIASAVVAVGSSLIVYYLVIMPMAHIIFMRVVQLGLAVAVAGVVYLMMLKAFNIEELKLLKQLIKR